MFQRDKSVFKKQEVTSQTRWISDPLIVLTKSETSTPIMYLFFLIFLTNDKSGLGRTERCEKGENRRKKEQRRRSEERRIEERRRRRRSYPSAAALCLSRSFSSPPSLTDSEELLPTATRIVPCGLQSCGSS